MRLGRACSGSGDHVGRSEVAVWGMQQHERLPHWSAPHTPSRPHAPDAPSRAHLRPQLGLWQGLGQSCLSIHAHARSPLTLSARWVTAPLRVSVLPERNQSSAGRSV